MIKGYGGNCLDVQGPSIADGPPVQMWDCNGATEMTWQGVGDEIHGYGGKCLDVRGYAAVSPDERNTHLGPPRCGLVG